MKKYTPGTYEGKAQGFASKIKLEVTVSEDTIEHIEVIEEHDTADIGHLVIPEIAKKIVEENWVDVDNVSGATFSSIGTKEAVRNALAVARGEEEPEPKYHEGRYQAESDGVKLNVHFSPTHIEKIDYEVSDQLENQKEALATMSNQVLESQRVEFDSVSGASQASRSMRDALNKIYDEASAVEIGDRLTESPIQDEVRVKVGNGTLTLEQINAILNLVAEEFVFVGPDLRFQYFDKGQKLYQYSTSSLGQLYTDCHPPQARAASRKIALELIQRKRKSYSFWYNDSKGDRLVISYNAIFDTNERFIGMVGWTMNVQPFLDIIDIPEQRGVYTDPTKPNPIMNETEEELEAYFNGGAEVDPARDYAVSELERLEEEAKRAGGEYDSISQASKAAAKDKK